MRFEIDSVTSLSLDYWKDYVTVMGHSHNIRSGEIDARAAMETLVKWASEKGAGGPPSERLGAVGIGSPWEPKSANLTRRAEGPDRDCYWGGAVDREEYMAREEVAEMIRQMNALSGGETLFYLDNETPKNRYGHLWYLGFQYKVPNFHDYGQDMRTAFWDRESTWDQNAVTGGPHLRRSYAEVVAEQRAGGALAVWAHPTSWWLGPRESFVTNIAAEMVLHWLADGYLDGMVVQGYDAFHRQYQNLWFHLLDFGARIPGFSEMDACFDHEAAFVRPINFLNYCPREWGEGEKPLESISDVIPAMRAGRHFMSSGPLLELRLDCEPSGGVVECKKGEILHGHLYVKPAPGQRTLSSVQIIGSGGEVLMDLPNASPCEIYFTLKVGQKNEWILARAFGEGDNPYAERHQDVKHCAITNPIYIRPKGGVDHGLPVPVRTKLVLRTHERSPWCGKAYRIVTAGGEPTEMSGVLSPEGQEWSVNPLSRILVEDDGRVQRDIPIAMANPRVRELLDYLADGHFRKDFPGLEAGEVPPQAFRVKDMVAALQEQVLEL